MKQKAIDKRQLFQALTHYLEAKLLAQLKEAEDLLAQASESNKAFFLTLRQTQGQAIKQQLEALQGYEPTLQGHFQAVDSGALLYLATKHLSVRVPAASTPEATYQSISRKTLLDRFEPIAPTLVYWWLLPRVVARTDQGVIDFDHQGLSIQVVNGEVFGYKKTNLTGLQAGECLFGVDYSGYYDERGNSTYPNIDLYQLQILAIS